MKKVLILGATSAIAQESAKYFAKDGDQIFLVGRNEDKLKSIREDLRVRGASKVALSTFDLNDTDQHQNILDQVKKELSSIDIVLIAYGTLSDQKKSQENFGEAEKEIRTNFLSVVSLLTLLSNEFESRRKGTIAVISSVAGDRGRQSNYIYGSSKGALNIFLQGLRNRLYASNVHVLTINPGFVDTPMTAHLNKNFLFASSECVGKKIYQAIGEKKNVVYIPFFWRFIMCIIKSIPEFIFKRLKL